jgi:Dolichyl-phosphate-mannose-protein mannosyltransferase
MELTESSEGRPYSTSAGRGAHRYIGLALGVAAFAMVIAITSGAGPGLDPDAMGYIGAATSVAHNGTFRVPSSLWDAPDSTSALTDWPPGFSVAMAIPQKLGVPRMTSARIVNATAAFITASLLFILLESAVGAGVAVVGVLAILVTPSFVGVHSSVLSEPLFLASLVLTLLGMTRRPKRPFVTGIPAAMAAIVRYAGVCAPMAVVLWFFFVDRKPMRQRFSDAMKAAVVPAIVVGAWVIRSARVPDPQESAPIGLYGGFEATIRQTAGTLVDWLAPVIAGSVGRAVLGIMVAVGIAVVVARAVRGLKTPTMNPRDAQAVELLKATTVLLGCYVTVLLSARVLIGDAIPFDFRLLSPIILLLEIVIAVSVTVFLRDAAKSARIASLAVFSLWFAGSVFISGQNAFEAVTDGFDFASSDWTDSPTLAWVQSRSAGWTLFTNWPAAVYFRTSRIARDVPQSLETGDLNEFRGILDRQHGAFVGFTLDNEDYPPSDSIAHAMGLVELARFSDGAVWVTKGSERR